MQPWLLMAAAMLAAPIPADVELKGLATVEIGPVATARALDLRLSQEMRGLQSVPLMRGMIVQHGIVPNATVGLGLSNLFERRKSGFDVSDDRALRRSRKPAVMFVLRF
jgi:hypothetical protein